MVILMMVVGVVVELLAVCNCTRNTLQLLLQLQLQLQQ